MLNTARACSLPKADEQKLIATEIGALRRQLNSLRRQVLLLENAPLLTFLQAAASIAESLNIDNDALRPALLLARTGRLAM